jgi:tRNA-intron endonuclease
MNPAHGELKQTHVLVKNTKDIGRLYGKSRLGTTDTNNHLKLNLIEAAFLQDEGKLDIYQQKKNVSFEHLVTYAASLDVAFETKFIIFQNLRNRGQQVSMNEDKNQFFFTQTKKEETGEKRYRILAYSERHPPNLTQLQQIVMEKPKIYDETWIAIADEEGDVTYYHVKPLQLTGTIPCYHYPKTKGILLKDRALIFDQTAAELLHTQEFYGRPFGNGLQLSLVEAAYLVNQEVLAIIDPSTRQAIPRNDLLEQISTYQPDISLRLRIFQDLKAHHMLIKTGFKFGTHFRGYTQKPDENHAEYLIHAVTPTYQGSWAEISRAIRLSHSVNKLFCFALYEQKTDTISYISLSRLRP